MTLFYAFTSDGRQFWKFLDGINNSLVTIHWLLSLHTALLLDDPKYRENHIVMEDNASPNVSKLTMAIKKLLRMPTMQTAAASFDALPVEKCFRTIKAMVNYDDKN